MLKVIQRGRNINSVYIFLDKIVIKKYTDSSQNNREYDGYKRWSNLSGEVSVKPFLSIRDISFSRFIRSSTIDKRKRKELIKQLASIFAKTLEKYKYHTDQKNKRYLDWQLYINNIIEKFNVLKEDLSDTLPKNNFNLLEGNINFLGTIDWGCFPKIPLHRDIHWDNILLEKDQIRIIDFEHFCIGPLEFEFCNSIFWNDEYSIDFDQIAEELEKYGISINKELTLMLTFAYFVEQFYITKKAEDQKKIILLTNLLSKFLKRYLNTFFGDVLSC